VSAAADLSRGRQPGVFSFGSNYRWQQDSLAIVSHVPFAIIGAKRGVLAG
jgi:hypothetical protein